MTTNAATNSATKNTDYLSLTLDFDKKKLTEKIMHCQAEHQRLQSWLKDPFIQRHFKRVTEGLAAESIARLTWGTSEKPERLKEIEQALSNPEHTDQNILVQNLLKDFRKNNSPARSLRLAGLFPCPASEIEAQINALIRWRESLSQQRLSPLYQTLISTYYLTLIQPLGIIQTAFNQVFLYHALQTMEFGVVADYILMFYAEHETILATTLASCYHARHKKYHQQPWFQLFCEAWDWALTKIDQEIQAYCFNALYLAKAQVYLDDKTLNERQYRLAMHLLQETDRERKSLQRCLWYKTLYQGLTKRTEERDYALLLELGFI